MPWTSLFATKLFVVKHYIPPWSYISLIKIWRKKFLCNIWYFAMNSTFCHKISLSKILHFTLKLLFVAKNFNPFFFGNIGHCAMSFTFDHKIICYKMFSLSKNILFVANNITWIIMMQYMTFYHDLHFLPQNYLWPNITFINEFTLCP